MVTAVLLPSLLLTYDRQHTQYGAGMSFKVMWLDQVHYCVGMRCLRTHRWKLPIV
jgi:hypothetical protein